MTHVLLWNQYYLRKAHGVNESEVLQLRLAIFRSTASGRAFCLFFLSSNTWILSHYIPASPPCMPPS